MEITDELAQKILNYLAKKPYAEVHTLIDELIASVKREKDVDNDNN